MPHQVRDLDVLRDYLRGVMDRAEHHAQNVNEVPLAVAGGVIWRKDDDPLEVMVREGEMKNVLCSKFKGKDSPCHTITKPERLNSGEEPRTEM